MKSCPRPVAIAKHWEIQMPVEVREAASMGIIYKWIFKIFLIIYYMKLTRGRVKRDTPSFLLPSEVLAEVQPVAGGRERGPDDAHGKRYGLGHCSAP